MTRRSLRSTLVGSGLLLVWAQPARAQVSVLAKGFMLDAAGSLTVA